MAEEEDSLVQFSFMAFFKHLFSLALLYHSHLVIKLCLGSLFKQIS